MRSCTIEGCDKEHAARGFCYSHYQQWWKKADHVLCSVDDCDRPSMARGLCDGHYTHWYKTGSVPTGLLGLPRHASIEERFFAKVRKQDDGCWIWTATRFDGYGRFWDRERVVAAHRFAYEHFVGQIPNGLEIDHLCRVRACVNPEHLEAVTAQVNSRRRSDAKRLSL